MFKNCVSGIEMPQTPNIFFSHTFYKISGAKSCSSPSQGPLAPPSLGVWVEQPLM